jgi:branched-chain amino acid transport system ATP-binding protein
MAILEVRQVNKSFRGLHALADVNLAVDEGSVHAIIGPNGAGKSTLLNCFVGRLAPDTGTILFEGESLIGLAPHDINQAGVARVFQTPEIFLDLSLLENVMVPTLARRDGPFRLNAWPRADAQAEVVERAEQALDDVGLARHRHESAGTLSRGDKRRLELAMCLVQDPKLLLLDEPTAGMSRADTQRTIDLLQRIGERRITKIIIEHDMEVVFSLASRISVLAQGSVIAEGSPRDIRGDPRVKEAYLGETQSNGPSAHGLRDDRH